MQGFRRALCGALVVAMLASATPSPADPAPGLADAPAPPLPHDKLLYLIEGGATFDFIVLDRLQKSADGADAYVYQVIDPPFLIGDARVSQGLDHVAIDCGARKHTELDTWAYDNLDQPVAAASIGPRPGATFGDDPQLDALAQYVCHGIDNAVGLKTPVDRPTAIALVAQAATKGSR